MSTTTTTTTTEAEIILRRAARIIRTVCGEEWGDGETVMDLGVGIVGGDSDAVWVTGDWNDTRHYNRATGQWVTMDNMPSRVLAALERIGVDCWWHDTCDRCAECHRLIDTEQMFGTAPAIWTDDAGHVCVECVVEDLAAYVEDYVNNPDRALPSQLDADAMIAAGWEYSAGDYRSGWCGRADSPAEILAEILAESPEGAEVVFQVTDAHMFELAFTVWTRTPQD